MDTPDARCALVAAEQYGCLSRAQADRAGLSIRAVQRRVATKRWTKILPGVFAIRGAPATWEQRLFAAVLWAGEGAAVAGMAAAGLWQLPEFPRGPIEITHPGTKQSRDGVTVHRVPLDDRDVARIGVIPVTAPARTLADVAGRVGDVRFDAAVHHCLHHRLTTLGELERIVAQRARRGCAGAARLRMTLDAYGLGDRPAASPLEAAVSRRLSSAGLRDFRRQHEVVCAGRRRFLDFAWPSAKVAVEVDGYRWHSSRSAWENDRRRLADLRRAGWFVIQVTKDDVDQRFAAVIDEIRRHL